MRLTTDDLRSDLNTTIKHQESRIFKDNSSTLFQWRIFSEIAHGKSVLVFSRDLLPPAI